MTKTKLAYFSQCSENELKEAIQSCFEEYDTGYRFGFPDDIFVSEAYKLNNIRRDIEQLREKLHKLFPPPMDGQCDLFGNEYDGSSEREIPPILPAYFKTKYYEVNRKLFFLNAF